MDKKVTVIGAGNVGATAAKICDDMKSKNKTNKCAFIKISLNYLINSLISFTCAFS